MNMTKLVIPTFFKVRFIQRKYSDSQGNHTLDLIILMILKKKICLMLYRIFDAYEPSLKWDVGLRKYICLKHQAREVHS